MAGFLANIAAALERKSAGTRFGAADDLWQKLYDNRSRAGVSVTAMTALRVTTVLACAIRIAEGTSTVPCKLFQKRPGDKDARHASGLSVNDVISRVPNGQQNSLELREQLTIHARIAGAAYCWINRVRGEIAELVPFEPEARIKLDRSNPDEWVYTFRLNDGSTVQLPQREVWHFRGPGWKTAEGFEATKVCRDAIGLAIATEESQSLLHANGAHPGGLLSIDGRLGDPGKQ
ncbi:MAG: phage portal protein, partial [bacterium]|nr:phage portal protein [bacterium]